jgi:hypothetical protein
MATKDITDRQVLAAYDESRRTRESGTKGWGWSEDLLAKTTGQPVKVCVCAMRRAEERGLIECGVSLHSGWITEKGRELLLASPENAQPTLLPA